MRLFTKCILSVAIILPAFVGSSFARSAGVLTGVAVAKDGDGVIIDAKEVRLKGIAAPEDYTNRHEPGGSEASANLHRLIDGKMVVCQLDGTKSHRRAVGVCYLDGKDIGELQVLAGHARDCPRYSGERYADAERTTRAQGRDLSAIYGLPAYCTPR